MLPNIAFRVRLTYFAGYLPRCMAMQEMCFAPNSISTTAARTNSSFQVDQLQQLSKFRISLKKYTPTPHNPCNHIKGPRFPYIAKCPGPAVRRKRSCTPCRAHLNTECGELGSVPCGSWEGGPMVRLYILHL